MTITATMVKELRERTGAGMMECKKALQEAGGDIETAITQMRKRGQAKAAKRAGKIAAEGIIIINLSDTAKEGAMIEVNSETDFVAREESFKDFAEDVAAQALAAATEDVNAVMTTTTSDGQTLEAKRQELVAKIGENIQVRRISHLSATGIVGRYLHGARIGVMVALDKEIPELARDIAMHVAASNPLAITKDQIPADVIEKEKEIFIAQAKESGKPDNIIEKMVSGRIAKFEKESCLLSQPFVKNPEQTVMSLLKQHDATVTGFIRFEVGEGIEKETQDFAAEVKAQIEGN